MNTPGPRIQSTCLLLAVFATGCGTETSFFRVRNPFQHEADAIADYRAHSKQRQAAPDLESRSEPAGIPEGGSAGSPRDSYFGRRTIEETSDSRLSKNDSPDEPAGPLRGPGIPPPPVPLSRKETVTAPRPPATGSVCYRCNGKGHHLTSLSTDSRMVECPDCGGTGRR